MLNFKLLCASSPFNCFKFFFGFVRNFFAKWIWSRIYQETSTVPKSHFVLLYRNIICNHLTTVPIKGFHDNPGLIFWRNTSTSLSALTTFHGLPFFHMNLQPNTLTWAYLKVS